MSNSCFSFKKFSVCQEACAMKVGMDGVLLGSWVRIPPNITSILDVGTGTGLLALMLSQRCQVSVTAIELDAAAAAQAAENVSRSPWSSTIKVLQGDFLRMSEEQKFDLIVSNPPYYKETLKSGNMQRAMARENDSLSYAGLMSKASCLLSDTGCFSIIIPAVYESALRALAVEYGLYINRFTQVKTKTDKPVKRILFEMGRIDSVCENSVLVLLDEQGNRSTGYEALTSAYYL